MNVRPNNFRRQESIADLVSYVKRLASRKETQEFDDQLIGSLSEDLVSCAPDLIDALRKDTDGILASIKLLSQYGQREAVSSLLSAVEIPRHDASLLDNVIRTALGGDSKTTHRWIADYDIVGQRLDVIQTIVLPYIDAYCPQKTVFRALKHYEAESLALNRPLLNPSEIYRVIDEAQKGTPLPPLREASTDRTDAVRLVLPNETFSTLLRLAWAAQDYLRDLHERYSPLEFIEVLRTLHKIVPVYLIPTHLGYPMGGGESFMHQTCRILCEFGVKCVWVSFLDPKAGWYSEDSITYTPYYIDVRYSGGCSKEAILRAVDQFEPDLIHAQGGTNDAAMEIAEQTRLTTLIGYHFWTGLIELGQSNNQHICENIFQHKLRTPPFQQSHLIRKYVASEFMRDVYHSLGGKEEIQIIHPISDAAQFLANRSDHGTYVLQVNVCPLKGGNIFLECVRALGDHIPFMGIESEPDSSDFMTRLTEEMVRHPLCELNSYGNVRQFYRTARMVIVPTLVDETFCRVAFEAAMNGIPVLSTSNGYLPQMLGDTGIFLPEDPAEWIAKIQELYHDVERLKQIGEAQRTRLQTMFGSDFRSFIQTAMQLLDGAATRNVGIFTVWGDQGMGNLAHAHTRLLRSVGYRVHIFSFQPYGAIGKSLVKQNNPEDWRVPANADSVYYSYNDREDVTVHELTQFILANNIHTLLVPEICWRPNWERLFNLRVNKLAICSIPMIEIVLRDEILHHNQLASTLYCTRQAEQVLAEAGVHNGAFIGHGFGRPLPRDRVENKRHRLAHRPKIRFLHVAGHNPRTRKNTPQVIEAFAKALALRNDVELTVTSMDPVATYYSEEIPAGITILDRSLSRDEILDLYEDHDISIQVSSHEGLGLGFYESISRCTPVLSLNAPPHNEIVLEGETGWLIPAEPIPMPDNEASVVSAWRFDTNALTSRIASLERDAIDAVILKTEQAFKTQFDEVALLTRLLQALPRKSTPEAFARNSVSEALLSESTRQATTHDSVRGGCLPASASISLTADVVDKSADERLQSTVKEPFSFTDRLKLQIRRNLYNTARWAYRLAKPITRRIAYRLRILVIDATSNLQNEMRSLADTNASLRHEVHKLSHAYDNLLREIRIIAKVGAEQRREQRAIAEVVNDRLEGLTRQTRSDRTELGAIANTMQQISHDIKLANCEIRLVNKKTHFIKDRIATYAGPNAVLTYLKDESPIFVNTGDLGCPSPIVNGGIWEPENLEVLYSFVRGDTVFLDVGANVGYFSVAIGNRLGAGGRVFAFEPHPSLTNLLERSVQLNSLERTVQIFECAASDRDGALNLFFPDGHLGRGSAARNLDEHGENLSVRALRLDELLPRDVSVDLVKIDVEGHEASVLRGMREILARSPDIKILFEKLEPTKSEHDEIFGLLRSLRLAFYGIGPHSVLVPLSEESYRAWIGDVLAAPADAVDRLTRTGFSIYPSQLSGIGQTMGGIARFQAEGPGIVFFGPGWYLRYGTWRVQFHGDFHGSLRLEIIGENEFVVAELILSKADPSGSFTVNDDITRFEMRAYAEAGAIVDLERIELQRM